MRKEIADLWINELESNYWQQGKYFLEHSGFYCVFGILANIAATKGICAHYGKNIGMFDGKLNLVPDSVVKWAELKSPIGEIRGFRCSLAEMNDNGKSFRELAEVIRKHYENL